jgi:(S)-ureidoglycine aminohydrolase
LTAGSYLFLPPKTRFKFFGASKGTKLLVFKKNFEPLAGEKIPTTICGHSDAIAGKPFLGHKDARLQVLLPDHPAFDMAVNIFTYDPGATLPFVETHIMEHGLLMLSGRGIYRLDADRHRVSAGDVIWMASYCPQWFIAQGKTPSSYIYYKDVNRAPL